MVGAMETVLARLLGTSVLLNGLRLPISTVESALARYTTNLFVRNDHPVHKISLVGSAVRVSLAGKYFLVCTNHQLRGRQLDKVCMMTKDGLTVNSSAARHFNDDTHADYLDLAAFDFTEPCQHLPHFRQDFLDLHAIPLNTPSNDAIFAILAGFPCDDQLYELEEKNHIGKTKRILLAVPDHQPSDTALICFRTQEPLDFNPDGMSGGSAFVVEFVENELKALFAGIIATAGVDRFRVIKAGYVHRFLSVISAM